MKQLLTVVFLLFYMSTYAQVKELRKLSKGKLVGAEVIYNESATNVYGYFLLYKADRLSREVYSMEYVVLDQNLNKVTSGSFVEGIYNSLGEKPTIRLVFARKIGDEIMFSYYDKTFLRPISVAAIYLSPYTNIRYRKLDLTDFSLSDEFVIRHHKHFNQSYQSGDGIRLKDFVSNQQLIPVNNGSFLLLSESDRKQDPGDIKSFMLFDTGFNKLWSAQINQNEDKDKRGEFSYSASDDKVLILKKVSLDNTPEAYDTFLIYDINTGRLIGRFADKDPHYRMVNFQVKILDDRIFFYNRLYRMKNKRYKDKKQLGYARVVFDKNTGKELDRDFLLWKTFNPYFDIKNEYGDIRKRGKLFLEEFVPLKNGHTLAIAEGYERKNSSRVYNLFTMEFDKDFDLVYFHEIKKKPTKIKSLKLTGSEIYSHGYFAYGFHQKLNDTEDYVFFYADNNRDNNLFGRRRHNPLWYLGIITYVNGNFHYDELKLTKEKVQIVPARAKNGSILLQVIHENGDVQMRLEQIYY